MKLRLGLAALGLTMALSGCATVPLSSIMALSSIQLETTDLAVFRVAMRLPDALRPLSDGTRLKSVIKIDGQSDRTEEFALVSVADPVETIDFQQRIDPGYSMHVFALSPDGRAGLDAARQAIAAARANGRHGSLSLNVALDEFCAASALPEGALYATSLIKTSETGRFVVLTNRVDMRSAAEFAGALDRVAPCPDALRHAALKRFGIAKGPGLLPGLSFSLRSGSGPERQALWASQRHRPSRRAEAGP